MFVEQTTEVKLSSNFNISKRIVKSQVKNKGPTKKNKIFNK